MMRVLVIVVAMVVTTAVGAQGFDGVSDASLARARSEIASMHEAELRSLLSYISECSDRGARSAVVIQACRSARLRYQTEYSQRRSIDAAIDDAEKLLEIRRIIDGGVPPGTISTDMTIREAVRAALQSKRR